MKLANTVEEITRIQRRPPPIVPIPLMNDTMVSKAWVNEPIYSYVGPMDHHVIAPTIRGDGFSSVRFGSKEIRTRSISGGVTVAPSGFSGNFECDGRPLASNVFLSRDRLQLCADELGGGRAPDLIPRLNAEDPKLFSILTLITREAETPGTHARLYLEHLIDLLCLQLFREHSALPKIDITDGDGGLSAWQVRRVTQYMLDHLDEPVGLQEIARSLQLSRFYFCKAFRRATGHTPHEWLVRLRMQRAKELLGDRRLTITEVGLAVGYQTPSAFAHAFRTVVGLTPTAFRHGLWS